MGLGVTSTAGSLRSWPPEVRPWSAQEDHKNQWAGLPGTGFAGQVRAHRLPSGPRTARHQTAGFSGRLVRLRWVLPVGDCDRVALEPGVSLQASCLSERTAPAPSLGASASCPLSPQQPAPGAQASSWPFWNAGAVAVGGSLAPGILLQKALV